MKKKLTAALLIAALTCTLLIACTPAAEESSSSSQAASSSSETASSSQAESASSEASSAESESANPSSGTSEAASSAASSKAPADGTSANGTNSKKYTETDENFTFKDGVYKRIYGNRAMFVVTKDPDSMDAKELKKSAEETAGQYYTDKYYCTVCFVKPDNSDGTFDITSKKSDDRVATIMSLHKPDSSKMTINLKERPLQEYIDKQVAKAKVSSK